MIATDAKRPTAEELAALLAHDLRTPLNAVRGFADLLLAGASGPLSAAQLDLVGEIARAARRLEAAVELAQELAEPAVDPEEGRALDLGPLLRQEGFVLTGAGPCGSAEIVLTGVPDLWRRLIRVCRLHLDGAAATAPHVAALIRGGPCCLELVMERPDMSRCWQVSALNERLLRRLAAMVGVRIASSPPHMPLVLRWRVERATCEG